MRVCLLSQLHKAALESMNRKVVLEGLRVLFVETAAAVETDAESWVQADVDLFRSFGTAVTRFTFSGQEEHAISEALNTHDVIFIEGGNTFYLLQEAVLSGAMPLIQKRIKEGMLYIGSSAGSVFAGPDINAVASLDSRAAAPKLTTTESLGLVPFVILPHWGRANFVEAHKRNYTALEHDPFPKVFLTDADWIYVTETGCEFLRI